MASDSLQFGRQMDALLTTQVLLWGIVFLLALLHGWRTGRRAAPHSPTESWIDHQVARGIPAICFGTLLGFNAVRYLVQLVPDIQWVVAGPALAIYGLFQLQQSWLQPVVSQHPPARPSSENELAINQWAESMLLGGLLYAVGLHQLFQLEEPIALAVLACAFCSLRVVPAWVKQGPMPWTTPATGALLMGLAAGVYVEHSTEGAVAPAPANIVVAAALLGSVIISRAARMPRRRKAGES